MGAPHAKTISANRFLHDECLYILYIYNQYKIQI